MEFAFPAVLEVHLVADAAFAAAYDALCPEDRGHLKSSIARTVAAQGYCACPEVSARSSSQAMRQGFVLYERLAPADWAVFFLDAAYAGPVRVLAALLPAVLAGVPNILVCRVAPQGKTGSFPAPVLAGLELAGQELVAEMSPEEANFFLRACCGLDARGRAVLLGGDACLDVLADVAGKHGLPLRRAAGPVRIGVDEQSLPPGAASLGNVLRFAHPDASFVSHATGGGTFSAIYCGENAVPRHLGSAPLVIAPGQETCWEWPDIDVAFFRERSRGFSAGTGDPAF